MRMRLGAALVALAVGAAVVVGAIAVARLDSPGERGSGLSDRFDYDLESTRRSTRRLIRYDAGRRDPRRHARCFAAVAVGPDDRIFVAGDKAVHVFDADGKKQSEIALDDRPTCLARRRRAGFYVGVETHVEVFGPDGKRIARWDDLGDRAVLTSIAADEDERVRGRRRQQIVLRYDRPASCSGGSADATPTRASRAS